jgi:D-alanine-D-alanine ligase
MRLCVLLGGSSAEREISLLSGYGMAQALANRGHDVMLLDPATNRAMLLEEFQVSAASIEPPSAEELGELTQGGMMLESLMSDTVREANMVVLGLHGVPGEDGLIQSVLELLGKRYTGSDSRASALCIDKHFTKIILKNAGVDVPKGMIVSTNSHPQERHATWELAKAEFGIPMVIKPNDQGSTVGLTILKEDSEDEFQKAIELALKYSRKALVEEFIEGRELTVGILGNEALPIVEITTKGGFYDYHHKYTAGMSFHTCPAELSIGIEDGIQSAALRAFEACGCRGYGRIDFRLQPDGKYFCLEINTLPGMTELSLLPDAAKAAGISFDELCERILMESQSANYG